MVVINSFEELETNGCTFNFVKYAETNVGTVYFCENDCEYYLVSNEVVQL